MKSVRHVPGLKCQECPRLFTGCGYQTALLAELTAQVYSIERISGLLLKARNTLKSLHYKNIHLKLGDGTLGWPEKAPFDAIIVTAAPAAVPQPLIDQLKPGGRMVIPVGGPSDVQQLLLVEKQSDGRTTTRRTLPVRFVPLTGDRGRKQ